MKHSELAKKLRKAKCRKIEEGTNHEKWYSPITNSYFYFPIHNGKEIKKGTAEAIMKEAGIKG